MEGVHPQLETPANVSVISGHVRGVKLSTGILCGLELTDTVASPSCTRGNQVVAAQSRFVCIAQHTAAG
jgi:hypothetical protein